MLDDPTLGLAMESLERAEAADAPDAPATPAPVTESAPEGERTAPPAEEQSDSPASQPPGTPATEVPAKPATEQPADKAGTKFAKDQARRVGTWKEVNHAKDELKREQDSFAQQRADFDRQLAAFKAHVEKANQPKYKPEDYEQASTKFLKDAEALEAAGKFDEADAKRVLAKQAVDYAKELRANPPAAPITDAQALETFKTAQKQWWGKAGIDFPEVLKDGPQKTALHALIQQNPALFQRDPEAMYWASRMAVAETSAARVPAMVKEMGELRAKVKELNDKLAIPGDGAVTIQQGQKPFSEKSEAEQESDLRREVESMPRF